MMRPYGSARPGGWLQDGQNYVEPVVGGFWEVLWCLLSIKIRRITTVTMTNDGTRGDNGLSGVVSGDGGGEEFSMTTLTLTFWFSFISANYFCDGIEQD